MSGEDLTAEQVAADKAMEKAISEWIVAYGAASEEHALMLTDYVMVCARAGYDDGGHHITGYSIMYSENVRPHSAVGLLSYALDQTKLEMDH